MDLDKNRFSVEKIEILDESTGEIILKDIACADSFLSKINGEDSHVYLDQNSVQDVEFDLSKAIQEKKQFEYSKSNKRQKQSHFQLNTFIEKLSKNNNFNDEFPKRNNFRSLKVDKDLIEKASKNSLSFASSSSPSSNEIDSHSFADTFSTNSDCKSKPDIAFDLKTSILKQTPIKSVSTNTHQNYSILSQEISKYSDSKFSSEEFLASKNEVKTRKFNKQLDSFEFNSNYNNKSNQNELFSNNFSDFNFNSLEMTLSLPTGVSNNTRNRKITCIDNDDSNKDVATCQFCGRAMLKKNIPTHIRRAHTPKEELVCLNEEQNIFTFHHLKPGQRRKRSTRAYDYNLMTSNVSINEYENCDEIENKFITEGQEILSSDLLHLADRIKYGIYQIPTSVLTRLIDILSRIESISNEDEIKENSKSVKDMISFYLISSEEFKMKVSQVGEDINEKKNQVNSLRAELKEVMARKMQLERKIQPILCDLQKLEDKHGSLIESELFEANNYLRFDINGEIKTNKTTT